MPHVYKGGTELREVDPAGSSSMMSPASRFARRCRRTLRRVGIATFAWLVAVLVLAGVARAGSSFVYCHLMDAVRTECCCVHAQDDAVDVRATDGPVVDMGCCDK